MSTITYQSVAKVCNQLQLLGNKPSVRKIRDQIGGSHTIIAEHLRTWRAESQLSESTNMVISPELQKAILAEFAQIASQVQLSVKETIEESNMDLKETMTALSECEVKYKQLELQFDEIQRKLHNDSLEFEKKLAACESTVAYLKEREIELQKKCAQANERAHQSEIQTAIANTKTDTFQNRIRELEEQLQVDKK